MLLFWRFAQRRLSKTQLLYGTGNPAKVQHMRNLLSSLDVEIVGIKELVGALPDIDESGNDPLENAIIKAKAFYVAFGKPVFSADSGLYFDEVSPGLQPGVHVRRVNGKNLTDTEMTSYYANLARQHGGKLTAQYRNAICFALSENVIHTRFAPDIWSDKFLLIDRPHEKRVEGFPLDCLSIRIGNGKYFYDDTYDVFKNKGWVEFFREALNLQ
jgi:8-oxo-dGTP diphosphatase